MHHFATEEFLPVVNIQIWPPQKMDFGPGDPLKWVQITFLTLVTLNHLAKECPGLILPPCHVAHYRLGVKSVCTIFGPLGHQRQKFN